MANLLITKVAYKGDSYSFESPTLSNGLSIVYGPNGSGKSTFINFIYYVMGGRVDEFSASNKETHYEITRDTNNYVVLDVQIDDIKYQLKRFLNRNDITIIDQDGGITFLPINRSKNEKNIFSDWMLEKLGINIIEVYQGINNFKINLRDLFRLIFHNQEGNPKKIYKPSDSDNPIADSELLRKIIFELLLGKTYSDYYGYLAQFKETERNRNIKKGMLEEYIQISRALSEKEEDLNLKFLNEKKVENEEQLVRLYNYRDSIKIQKQDNNFAFGEIAEIKSKLANDEMTLNDLERKTREIVIELSKLNRLKDYIIVEVTQIKKIVHTHEKLNLFSADTCPYCLRPVDRQSGHCVCGKEIEESQYERFFYRSDEYIDILKSKQKSVETINDAIASYHREKEALGSKSEELKSNILVGRNKILNLLKNLDNNGNLSKITEIDDQILKVREVIDKLNQRIEIELKRESLQKNLDESNSTLDSIKEKLQQLELESKQDMKDKITEFNSIYNELMVSTLKYCRNARIDSENYMPIIDDGVYKEASASVSMRLMYYFSLLYMSLTNDDVKFPRFLLIDTPATAGIDWENLIKCLQQISKFYETKKSFQIILSTGIDKKDDTGLYPAEYETKVVIKLTDGDGRLLKRRTNQ